MGVNSLMVVKQPGSFDGQRTAQVTRQASASPMVLQQFMQILANLSQKVDALALRSEQLPVARPAQIVPMRAKPVESTEVDLEDDLDDSPLQTQRDTRVNRNSLLDIFD